MGRVVGIYTSVGAGGTMTSREVVDVVAGKGIPGDRYAEGEGTFKDMPYRNRELTLVEAESAAAVGLPAAQLRRNVVVEGVRLGDLIGHRFRLGDVVAFGARKCAPCEHIEKATARPGLRAELDGGLRADVLVGGRLRVGDPIGPIEIET